MDLHDWLLFIHLLASFVVVTALVALWVLVLATRPVVASLDSSAAMRIGKVAGPMVGAGMGVALVFGIWLAFQVDGYHVWDAWIVAAIVLWALAGWAGGTSGKLFNANDASKRPKAVQLQAINTLAVVVILILMIWKPGA